MIGQSERCLGRAVRLKSNPENPRQIAERYASEFLKELNPNNNPRQECEWTCLLWSQEYWSERARRAKIGLVEMKERLNSTQNSELNQLSSESRYLNTTALVYSNLFQDGEKSCDVKKFWACPHLEQREALIRTGELANLFMTIVHKAALSSMLEKYPIDNGLRQIEYHDVYGVDVSDFTDLTDSLTDGRFAKLYNAALMSSRAVGMARL